AGDELLKQIAQRLRSTLRPRDDVARLDGQSTPMPARIGGDEFVILLEGLHEYDDAITVANRLLDVLAVPYDILG
ncbi:diguanylate cyclase domain-containing protein, partial [Acinetobacter baumannii]|uniref:diguanylate cyclase domain-containing protein n=1 Tax=Acinetobacter baumannii TaxID=470 RepID=UPI001111ACEE